MENNNLWKRGIFGTLYIYYYIIIIIYIYIRGGGDYDTDTIYLCVSFCVYFEVDYDTDLLVLSSQ
jgi:hypothetical protein